MNKVCQKLNSCSKVVTVLDKDLAGDWQYAECIRVVCAKCNENKSLTKTIAVIPCYNEAKYIGQVVSGALKYVNAVVVCDDGSTDGTNQLAYQVGAQVVGFAKRSGAGMAVRHGIMYALCSKPDILILMDGDGQHDPADIPALLKPILDGDADVVMGSRLGKHDRRPFYRRVSNRFGTWLANLNNLDKVADAITGYWAIRADKLPKLTEKGWGWAIELLMKSRAEKLRIISVPVKAVWHDDPHENSSLSPALLGLIVLWKIIKWRMECLV